MADCSFEVSARGVVFFRQQDNLTNELQKQFIHSLGEAVGKPKESSLHVHPLLNDTSDLGVDDPQISHISSVQREKFIKHLVDDTDKYSYRGAEWHSDVQFERFPPDYTSLRVTQLPKNDGDTLWASGYEIYDRFSPAYQRFFETLTARFDGEGYRKAAQNEKLKIREDNRGHPLNIALSSEHPVVRTNPVTGWKSVFAIGPFPSRIKQLTSTESQELLAKFMRMITENHDLTVRFKWKNPNDIAIWDNRYEYRDLWYDGSLLLIGAHSTRQRTTMKDWESDTEIGQSESESSHILIPVASQGAKISTTLQHINIVGTWEGVWQGFAEH